MFLYPPLLCVVITPIFPHPVSQSAREDTDGIQQKLATYAALPAQHSATDSRGTGLSVPIPSTNEISKIERNSHQPPASSLGTGWLPPEVEVSQFDRPPFGSPGDFPLWESAQEIPRNRRTGTPSQKHIVMDLVGEPQMGTLCTRYAQVRREQTPLSTKS